MIMMIVMSIILISISIGIIRVIIIMIVITIHIMIVGTYAVPYIHKYWQIFANIDQLLMNIDNF